MYDLDVTIYARPAQLGSSHRVTLGHQLVSTLPVRPHQLTKALPLCFEEASRRLIAFPNMIIEPDGSFVWTSGNRRPRWQVDGVLYGRDDALLFIQLKGSCPRQHFDQFLQVVDWPEFDLVFQLNRHAVYVDEFELRRMVANDPA